MENVKHLLGDRIEYGKDKYEVLDGTDALLIVTEWPEFRTPDMDYLSKKLSNKVIFDGRNLYEPEIMEEHGFTYYCIGRKKVEGK